MHSKADRRPLQRLCTDAAQKSKGGTPMQNITEIELAGYSQLLGREQNAIQKFKSYAESCEDPALQKLCEDMAQRHTQHYHTILNEMKK